MYQFAACPNAPSISRSMKSGTPSSTAPGPFSSAGIRRAQAASRKAHSSKVKYLGEWACAGDFINAERGTQAAIEKVGTRTIILRRKSRRLGDFSDLLVTIPNLTSPSFFGGTGKLRTELFHDLAHESGQIGRLPGRDQIGVNNHLPVLIERAGLFQFISHRLVAGGASPLQKAGADQDLRPVADGGNRFAAGKKAPGDLQRLRLFSHQRRRRPTGQDQDCIVVWVDLVKGLVHGHFVAVLALDGPAAQGCLLYTSPSPRD